MLLRHFQIHSAVTVWHCEWTAAATLWLTLKACACFPLLQFDMFTFNVCICVCTGQHNQYSDLLWAGWSGVRTTVGSRFSLTSPRPIYPSVKWVQVLFLGVKRPELCVNHPPSSSSVEAKEGVVFCRKNLFMSVRRCGALHSTWPEYSEMCGSGWEPEWESYVVGWSKILRSDIQKLRQMENAVRDI